jgi:hypothetical protein
MFKLWGGASPVAPIPLALGFTAQPIRAIRSGGDAELLLTFNNVADPSGAYAIVLPLSGKPTPTLPPP